MPNNDREALIEVIHSGNEFDYDECQHGTYSGGASHGEPYAMCERMADRILRWQASQPTERTDAEIEAAMEGILAIWRAESAARRERSPLEFSYAFARAALAAADRVREGNR